MVKWNRKSVFLVEPDMIIESDTSKHGWGAFCQDTSTGVPGLKRKKMAHKLSQIVSGDSSTEDICETQGASISFAQDEQHNSSGLHQQSKGTVSKDLVTLT